MAMAVAAAAEAAASLQPRAPMPVRADDVRGLLLGLPPDARAEDIEYVLFDVQQTLTSLASKREALQHQIATASRGKRRAPVPRRRAPPTPAAPAVVVPAADNDPGARYTYTREGAGALRRILRANAGEVKKERKRLEAVWGDLQEALVNARERLVLQAGERTVA